MLRQRVPKHNAAKKTAHKPKVAKKRVVAKKAPVSFKQSRNAVTITAAMVKKLRDATGAPMIECKKALGQMLEQPDFDVDNSEAVLKGASEYLRKRGAALANKNADRTAQEGLVVYAVNKDKTKAALVELNCETDFVARNGTFMSYAARLALTFLNAEQKTKITNANFLGTELNVEEYKENKLAAGPSAMPSNPNAAENNVATELIDVITNCRENIKLRRVGLVEVPAGKKGFVSAYMHNEIPHADDFKAFFDKVNNDEGISLRLGNAAAIGAFVVDDAAQVDQDVQDLGRKIMMQAVASAPTYLSRHTVPEDVVAKEKEIMLAQTPVDGKPQHIIDKLLQGKINKFFSGICLMEQEFSLTNDNKPPTIAELVDRHPAKPAPVAVIKYLRGELLAGEEFKMDDEQKM